MKTIKSIWTDKLALIMAMALTATACQQDDIIDSIDVKPQGEYINFNIERGWDYDVISRGSDTEYGSHISDHNLTTADQSESIEMSAWQQSIDSWFDGTDSRGTMIAQANFNEFMAFGYKTKDGTTTQIFNTYHKKDGAMWEQPKGAAGSENENGYYWPGADYTCNFFGIAMSDNKLTNESFYSNVTTTANGDGQIVSFDYTVPNAAIDQPDIMVASSGVVAGDGSQGATLNFKHILTAVNIKVGTTMQNGTIQSITFKNIYGKGRYTIGSSTWSNFREFADTRDFSVNLDAAGFSTTTNMGEDAKKITQGSTTLMMLPQTLRNDAAIEIEFLHSGASKAIKLTASIGGSSWGMGLETNYLINISPNNDLMFTSAIAEVDAHYVIVPFTIKAQNLSKGWKMTASASDGTTVTLRDNLTTLQSQGYWTVNERGESTLTSTVGGDAVSVYAFVEENLSTNSNRTITLELANAANNVVVASKTFTQLCMSAVRSERKEETSYVPWGFKWDRKVTYHAAPSLSGSNLSTILKNVFAAVLFNSIGEDIVEKYPEAKNSGVLTINKSYSKFLLWDVHSATDIVIDYAKLDNLGTTAQSEIDGSNNTDGLYYFNGIASISDLETLLDTEKSGFAASAVTKSTTGSLTDNSYITDFAAKSCVMKNKFYAEKKTVDEDGGTREYFVPVLSSNETASTTDNFSYLNWYLPASGEYQGIYDTEKDGSYALNGVYWTSTAVANDNANSYIYTPGTGIDKDDRMKTYLVRCKRKQ